MESRATISNHVRGVSASTRHHLKITHWKQKGEKLAVSVSMMSLKLATLAQAQGAPLPRHSRIIIPASLVGMASRVGMASVVGMPSLPLGAFGPLPLGPLAYQFEAVAAVPSQTVRSVHEPFWLCRSLDRVWLSSGFPSQNL